MRSVHLRSSLFGRRRRTLPQRAGAPPLDESVEEFVPFRAAARRSMGTPSVTRTNSPAARSYTVPLYGAMASKPSSPLSVSAKAVHWSSSPWLTKTMVGLFWKPFSQFRRPCLSAWPEMPGM